MHCPCDRGDRLKRCCGPVLAGEREPDDPADVVRARYVAFVRGDGDYLVRSHHPRTLCRFDLASNLSWARDNTWLGLEIRGATIAADGQSAQVEFVATYRDATGLTHRHHERSDLRRDGAAWRFYDGTPAGDARP